MLYVFSTPLFCGSWVNRMNGIVLYINGRSRGWWGVVSWKVNLSCTRSSWSRTCTDRDFSDCRNCVILWYCPCSLSLCGCIFGCMILSSLIFLEEKKRFDKGVSRYHYLRPWVHEWTTKPWQSTYNPLPSHTPRLLPPRPAPTVSCTTWHPFTRRPQVPPVPVSRKTISLIV